MRSFRSYLLGAIALFAGVTVYVFDGDGYRKETFLKSATLASAMKRYGSKP